MKWGCCFFIAFVSFFFYVGTHLSFGFNGGWLSLPIGEGRGGAAHPFNRFRSNIVLFTEVFHHLLFTALEYHGNFMRLSVTQLSFVVFFKEISKYFLKIFI